MKRMVILALLLICVNQANGMNEPKQQFYYESLLPELQRTIINTALKSSNNLDEALNVIKNICVVQGIDYNKLFNNLKDFTTFVHVLSDKFKISTYAVAQKINTSIAEKYIELGRELMLAAKRPSSIVKMKKLLADGADVNFSGFSSSPVSSAELFYNNEGLKLLFASGLKLSLDRMKNMLKIKNLSDEVKQIIEEEIKKQQK